MNPVAVGSLDQVHGPCPLGVSGADPGLASQARKAGRKQCFRAPANVMLGGVNAHHSSPSVQSRSEELPHSPGFSQPREVFKSEEENLRTTQGTESRAPFADLASVPFTLKCQQNCFTAGLGP